MILIDINEPKEVFDAFKKCNIPYRKTRLPVGDFTNDKNTFVAERKGFMDFWASMTDHRIDEQPAKMYSLYSKNRYVFVESGSLADLPDVIKEKRKKYRKGKAYPDPTNWIYSKYGEIENWDCNFREYIDLEDLARKIEALDQKLGNEKVLREKQIKMYGSTIAEKMLAQCAGIGPDKAKAALKKCKTLNRVFKDLYFNQFLLDQIKGFKKDGTILKNLKKELERKHD